MMVNLTIAVYQQQIGRNLSWTAICLDGARIFVHGRSASKLQLRLVRILREYLKKIPQADIEGWRLYRGMRLELARLNLSWVGRASRHQINARFPLLVTPRWINADEQVNLVCHPAYQQHWFVHDPKQQLAEQASRFFSSAWAAIDEGDIEALTHGKHQLKVVSFSVDILSLLDRHRDSAKKGAVLKRAKKPVLESIGINETQRAVDGTWALGSPRQPYRNQLARLLTGATKQSAVVLGPSQSGKSTIIRQLVSDLLDAEDFPAHRNLDLVHQVWRISGSRIIAGMSIMGEWEERCFDLLSECRKRRALLWVEDLQLFGRIGQSKESARALADVLRGPVANGKLILIGECTIQKWQRLEDDAPSFAELFSRVVVAPTSTAETLQLLIEQARSLELQHHCRVQPTSFKTIVEMAGSLLAHTAFPGSATSLLQSLCRGARPGSDSGDEPTEITPTEVIELVSQRTGVPSTILSPHTRLDMQAVRAGFASRVMGQPAALEVACSLTARVRAGLTDPERPHSVLLFTGPTGTGKTELARCLAEQLYGDPQRLLRFDMSEFAAADAVMRLIGDRYQPDGLLTAALRRQPFCVVLLDEIEKAHRSVLYLLLQLFDEGRLSDAAGNIASFHQATIVMTSNLGSRTTRPIGFGESNASLLADIDKAVKRHFPPELFNRIDQVVPFHPLDEQAALRIVTKELARVLARRGLNERNVFVYANQRVKRRIVEEAFDTRLGARTVKRYIEDHIVSLLVEQLSRGTHASLQVMRIFESGGEFQLHVEHLLEAAAEQAQFPLEQLAAASTLDLLSHASELLTRLTTLKRIVTERRQHGIESEQLSGAYYLDSYELQLDELTQWLQSRLEQEPQYDEPLQYAYARTRPTKWRAAYRYRKIDPKRLRWRPAAKKDQLVEVATTVERLARLWPNVMDAAAHQVTVELLRMGQHGRARVLGSHHQAGLLEWLTLAYASEPALVGAAVRYQDGSVRSLADRSALTEALTAGAQHVMLDLAQLFIFDRYAGERGSHIWRSSAAEPEIVRVRVLPASDLSLPERMQQHLANVAEFERCLDSGRLPLPDNPEQLDSAVRTMTFSPPLDGQSGFSVEVEDFRRSYAAQITVTSVAQLLAQLWRLWDGRRPLDAAPGQS